MCFRCVHAQRVLSTRDSLFYRCAYSDIDPSFPKYPQLPVRRCGAYELAPGSELYHGHSTFHFVGEPDVLEPIAKRVLGVSLADIAK